MDEVAQSSHGCDSFFAVAKKLIPDISEPVNGIEFMRRKGREYGTHGNNGTHEIFVRSNDLQVEFCFRVFRYFRLFRILSSANITLDFRK